MRKGNVKIRPVKSILTLMTEGRNFANPNVLDEKRKGNLKIECLKSSSVHTIAASSNFLVESLRAIQIFSP